MRTMKGIFPVFVMAAPALLLLSCARCDAAGQLSKTSGTAKQTNEPSIAEMAAGRSLFLKNCAHCHGADAHGDEGPDLHGLDWTDQQIAARIRNGKKGQMTSFQGKLKPEQISDLIVYLRSLK